MWEKGRMYDFLAPSDPDAGKFDREKAFSEALAARLRPENVLVMVTIRGDRADMLFHSVDDTASIQDGKHFVETVSSIFSHDAENDTCTLAERVNGRGTECECVKGGIVEFFQGPSTCPADVFFHLLDEYGVHPDVIGVHLNICTPVPKSFVPVSGRYSDKKTPPGWRLVEDVTIPDPFNHAADDIERKSLYTDGNLLVFTQTDLDDSRDEEGVCHVFLSFGAFVSAPCADFEFPDTEENRAAFLASLDAASGRVHDAVDLGEVPTLFGQCLEEEIDKRIASPEN